MKKILFVLLLVGGFAGGALATPITFIHTGTGASGSLAGVGFAGVDFVITAAGDTSARTDLGFGFTIDHLTRRSTSAASVC